MEKTAEVEDWLEDVTCPSVDSTGVNSSNLNSSPQNLLYVKDVVAQVAMRYKGPPGGGESTAMECRMRPGA